jgi:MFS transporter, MHS family, metabolite:H+ symporter
MTVDSLIANEIEKFSQLEAISMSKSALAETQSGSTESTRDQNLRRATTASIIGSTLEFYDFALYGTASALIFGKLFFPALGSAAGVVASFATYAVGFLVRPLGGLFFGVVGDKYGRKIVLISTISLMGLASTLIGILPTAQQVGALAPALLVILRLLQGFGAGAEQAGVATMMVEYAPRDRRGFYASLPFVGIPGGLLLASAVYVWLGSLNYEALIGGIWRIPFLFSGVLLLVALFVRYRLQESPAFEALKAERGNIQKRPVRDVFKTSAPNLIKGIGLRIAENGNSYIYYTLTLSYMTGVTRLHVSTGSLAVAIGCIIGIPAVPIFGALSDRFGRVPIYRAACLGMMLFAAPSWWLLSLGNPTISVIVVAIGVGIGIYSMLGPQVALLPELFGNKDRYLAVAICREFSAVIAGGCAPLIGSLLLIATNNSWWPIAVYVARMAGVGFLATLYTPETRGRDLTLKHDAIDGESQW